MIARNYVDAMGSDEILRALHVRRKIITAVAAAMATALLLWGIGVGIALWDAHANANRHFEIVTYECLPE